MDAALKIGVLRWEAAHFLSDDCIVCLRGQAPQPSELPNINHCIGRFHTAVVDITRYIPRLGYNHTAFHCSLELLRIFFYLDYDM